MSHQIKKEQVEEYETRMFGTPPTHTIPYDKLQKGQMQNYLRSHIEYLNKYSIGKFQIPNWKPMTAKDFQLNKLNAKCYFHEFSGFNDGPKATLFWHESEEMSITDYINLRTKEGCGTIKGFYKDAWKGRNFSYMHDIDISKDFCDTKFKWDLSTENGLPPNLGGISTPFLYIGSKYSMFPLHLEDVNLRKLDTKARSLN